MHQSTFLFSHKGKTCLLDYFCARSKDNKASSSMYIHTRAPRAGFLPTGAPNHPSSIRTRHDRLHGGGGNHPVSSLQSRVVPLFVSNRLSDGLWPCRQTPLDATAVLSE